jgi:hypothetical protein
MTMFLSFMMTQSAFVEPQSMTNFIVEYFLQTYKKGCSKEQPNHEKISKIRSYIAALLVICLLVPTHHFG